MNAAEMHGRDCGCDACRDRDHDNWVAETVANRIAAYIETEVELGAERAYRPMLTQLAENIRRGDWRR